MQRSMQKIQFLHAPLHLRFCLFDFVFDYFVSFRKIIETFSSKLELNRV